MALTMDKRGTLFTLKDDRWSKIKNSILTRIILFAFMIIIIGGFTRYYLSFQTIHTNLFKVLSIHLEALADEGAQDVIHNLDVRKRFLTKLASLLPPSLLEDPKALKKWLIEREELNPVFSGALFVLNKEGTLIAGNGTEMIEAEKAYAEDGFFKQAMTQAFVIGTPIVSTISTVPVLPLSVPIKDDLGNIRAVLVGMTNFDTPGFFDRVLNGHIGQTGGFLLVDAKKQIFVAASQRELILKPTPKRGANLLHDKAISGFRGSGITINAHGIEELSAVASVPDTDWFVVSRIQTKEAFAMEENIKTTLIRAHAASLIIVPSILFAFLFFFFRPLRTSASLADKMSLGEVPLKPLPIKRMDELGYLTAAFNRLMAMLLESQKELKEIAHYDYLTKLPNRFLMVDRLAQALARCARNDTRLALLFMDLDGFKAINDSLGHNAGDEALIEVAKRFSSLIRTSDTLARIGGDEFVILLSDLDGDLSCATSAASLVVSKCTEALKEPFILKGNRRYLGVSIGMAIGNKESLLDDLMVEADTKMYKTKNRTIPHINAIPSSVNIPLQ